MQDMKIDGEIVEFQTGAPWFEREKSGLKSSTVRIFRDPEEELKFINSIFQFLSVRISNPETQEVFVRRITDISVYRMLPNTNVYIISWDGNRV